MKSRIKDFLFKHVICKMFSDYIDAKQLNSEVFVLSKSLKLLAPPDRQRVLGIIRDNLAVDVAECLIQNKLIRIDEMLGVVGGQGIVSIKASIRVFKQR